MQRTADLRSDTFALPTDEMYAALREAALGDDVYGEDPTVNALEAKAAAITGKQAALLLASGTQANLVALMSLCQRGEEVLLGMYCDLYNFETSGIAGIAGLHPRPLDDEKGWISPAAVAAAVRPDDVHFGRTRLLCLENTHARSGGTPIPVDVLKSLAATARQHGLLVHIDGARLFNAAVALRVEPAAIASYADSVSFCLSKGLSCPVGSLLCSDATVIARARRIRKMLGGGMRQAGWIAAPGLVALDCIERLAEDHARAHRLALGLASIKGLRVDVARVRTNIVMVEVEPPHPNAAFLIAALREHCVRCFSLGAGLRMVVHRNVDDDAIEHTIEACRLAMSAPVASAKPGQRGPY
jgi:threonine aldolase